MDSAPCHERLLKPRSTPLAATTHYVPADRDRGRRDGSHFPAKLVSQLRGTAFGRNILVSLDDQHTRTHTHTRTHAHTTSVRRFESPSYHAITLLAPGVIDHWSIGISSLACAPSLIQLLLACDHYSCSCSTDTALPGAVPQSRLFLPVLHCTLALLKTLTHVVARSRLSSRLLHRERGPCTNSALQLPAAWAARLGSTLLSNMILWPCGMLTRLHGPGPCITAVLLHTCAPD